MAESLIQSRRSFLRSSIGLMVAAAAGPAIVRCTSLMSIKPLPVPAALLVVNDGVDWVEYAQVWSIAERDDGLYGLNLIKGRSWVDAEGNACYSRDPIRDMYLCAVDYSVACFLEPGDVIKLSGSPQWRPFR